jgi:Tol biopolymer transport system component
VLDGVYSAGRLRQAYFTVSRNGVLVWTAGRAAAAQLTWFDRRGKALATAGPPGEPEFIRQSPDDRHILIWPRVGPTRIVETARQEELMIPGIGRGFWSPDGSRLIHSGPGEAGSSVMERIVATGETRELFSFPGKVILRDLSADGRALMYQAGEELYFRRLDRLSDPPQRIFHGRTIGRFSPDGNWMLRIQFGKRPQIYLERFPSRSVSAQITPDGGTDPVWRGDGKEILYRSIKTIFSVRVETRGEKLQVSEPQPLFEVKRPPVLGSSQIMAVSSDGSRILFAQATDAIFPPTVYVMTAWAD